jgi:hypothetical protein
MAMKKDASGRRFVEVEFELPGTPEQIWNAIATGPHHSLVRAVGGRDA